MKTTKKTGTFEGKSNKLGGGGRFAQMTASGKSPALAAFIGRKLYGKKKMAKMAAKGKKSGDSEGVADVSDKNEGAEKEFSKGIAVGNPKKVR
jgi:hypothetical protein